MPKIGRPTKLTPAIQRRIAKAIRLGLTYALAAEYGGISYFTFNNWMKAGEEVDTETDPDNPYLQFLQAVKKSEADLAVEIMTEIKAASKDPKHWQAGAWILERRWPEMYGRQRIEHSGPDGGPIPVKAYEVFSPDDWDSPAP